MKSTITITDKFSGLRIGDVITTTETRWMERIWSRLWGFPTGNHERVTDVQSDTTLTVERFDPVPRWQRLAATVLFFLLVLCLVGALTK